MSSRPHREERVIEIVIIGEAEVSISNLFEELTRLLTREQIERIVTTLDQTQMAILTRMLDETRHRVLSRKTVLEEDG